MRRMFRISVYYLRKEEVKYKDRWLLFLWVTYKINSFSFPLKIGRTHNFSVDADVLN